MLPKVVNGALRFQLHSYHLSHATDTVSSLNKVIILSLFSKKKFQETDHLVQLASSLPYHDYSED